MYVNGVDQGHLTGIRVPDFNGVRRPSLSSESYLTRDTAHYGRDLKR